MTSRPAFFIPMRASGSPRDLSSPDKHRHSVVLLLLLFIFVFSCGAQGSLRFNMPEKLQLQFATGPFAAAYSISDRINPFYLRGDYDGDRRLCYYNGRASGGDIACNLNIRGPGATERCHCGSGLRDPHLHAASGLTMLGFSSGYGTVFKVDTPAGRACCITSPRGSAGLLSPRTVWGLGTGNRAESEGNLAPCFGLAAVLKSL